MVELAAKLKKKKTWNTFPDVKSKLKELVPSEPIYQDLKLKLKSSIVQTPYT